MDKPYREQHDRACYCFQRPMEVSYVKSFFSRAVPLNWSIGGLMEMFSDACGRMCAMGEVIYDLKTKFILHSHFLNVIFLVYENFSFKNLRVNDT